MKTKLRLVFSITILFSSFYSYSQQTYWKNARPTIRATSSVLKDVDLSNASMFTLDVASFKSKLPTASHEGKSAYKTVYFPDNKGVIVAFNVKESSVMAPSLQMKYTNIRSYAGKGVLDPTQQIRFSVSPEGMQSMMVVAGEKEAVFMQKSTENSDNYMVYKRSQTAKKELDFLCNATSLSSKSIGSLTKKTNDQTLRTYRVAISASGEYTSFHGGTVAGAMAAINATLTRVNSVLEIDLAVHLELVANNDDLIYTNGSTDPYTTVANYNNQAQTTIDEVIGAANYDVGHVLLQGDNDGNAGFIGSVCANGKKGSAYTSGETPEGDIFDLDFFTHELGHQFGANHTWSFDSEATGVQVEPASGTTIMGYAGIQAGQNVAAHGDAYFHYISISQMVDYMATTTCATTTALTNNPPTIAALVNYSIPAGTAFELTAVATDPDVLDVLTYTWEQIDDGRVRTATFGPTKTSGANFRSLPPSINPNRFFPRLERIVDGNLTQTNPPQGSAWETVSTVSRELNFAVNVRDNALGGGQLVGSTMTIEVEGEAGPFLVTSQSSGVAYNTGDIITVDWDVANTNLAPISTTGVDLYLSIDGGISFPINLASNVPNNGSYNVQLPASPSTNARIMVKGHDQIFLAVNSSDFSIQEQPVTLSFDKLDYEVCSPTNLDIDFKYITGLGHATESIFSVSGMPVNLTAIFSPTSATTNTDVSVSFGNIVNVTPGLYTVVVTAVSGVITEEVPIQIKVLDNVFVPVVLSAPEDNALEVPLSVTLEWEEDVASSSYDVEVARDALFSDLVASETVSSNFFSPKNLESQTIYYWRVKPKNSCGEGVFGVLRSFETVLVNCIAKNATGLPIVISSSGTPTITSSLDFIQDISIVDVNVKLNIKHSYIADLEVNLISPMGTKVSLISSSCEDALNVDATFDDDGSLISCGINPGVVGLVKPVGFLGVLEGESARGLWILEIKDTANSDGGSLESFELEICGVGPLRPDADNDNVFDDGPDVCLGTPDGAEVDINGCEVFRFNASNFEVEITGASCRGTATGEINITANTVLDYKGVLTGVGTNSKDFTNSTSFKDLAAGSYKLCFTATEGVNIYEELCYDIVINQPESLVVSASLQSLKKEVILNLSGASFYTIEQNGVVVKQTSDSKINLSLKKGVNTIKVYTDLPCQGVFQEQFISLEAPVVAPNPVNETTVIYFGTPVKDVKVGVYTIAGQLVFEKAEKEVTFEMSLPLGQLSPGNYVVKINADIVDVAYRLVKE